MLVSVLAVLLSAAAAQGVDLSEVCKKYAESVFVKIPDLQGGGSTLYDTCYREEPSVTLGGGIHAGAREYPHMALIGYGSPNNIKWLCGGSLISERFILSAAHCTGTVGKREARWVRLGEYNVRSKEDDDLGIASPVDYEIIERINHPEYKPPSLYNDIALYKLNTTVDFNEYVRPICLQTNHSFSETSAIATGWGRTESGERTSDILKKVNLTITPWKQCSDVYNVTKVGLLLSDGIQDSSQLCAKSTEAGRDTCQGDGGGPLQLRLKQPYCMYSLVGVTSFGDSGCNGGKPGVYTRVSHFVPWIEGIVWN